jgi:ABC-2 type transport system permease protein
MPIFDQGYQHWQGSLSGHGWRWLAVTRHGVRVGMQNRFVRMLILFAWFPALLLVGVISLWGMVEQKAEAAMSLLASIGFAQEFIDNPATFRLTIWTYTFRYFILTELFYVLLLVTMVGPGLISQDLRYNALPLYFSRPVRRIDYFLGKLGVIGCLLLMVAVLPAVAAWVFGVLFSLDYTVIFDTWRILVGVIVYGVVVTLSAGLLMLALSSLSRNSRYVGALWAGFCLVSFLVGMILVGTHVSSAESRVYQRWQRDRDAQVRRDQEEQWRDAQDMQMPLAEKAKRQEARQRRQMEWNQGPGPEMRNAQTEAFRDDWRLCVSYVNNLLRMGDALLGYYEAQDRLNALWATVRRAQAARGPGAPGPPPRQHATEEDEELYWPRWPWYWSASVLLALGGLSAWILNTRVKTLDRLR